MIWMESWRADPYANAIAKRHYTCQSPDSAQFVPPGACVVLTAPARVWVTNWPKAEYVKHAWAGAWVNSMFRRELDDDPFPASSLIVQAVAATRWYWPDVPPLGMVSFVDPAKVPGVRRRGQLLYGYSYLRAGFEHVGYTEAGLWTWQMKPEAMPAAFAPYGVTARMFDDAHPARDHK